MKQIFILGSSTAYGVGASRGGWGDLVKMHLHEKMYGKDGEGEKYEVYNLAKSGATIDFVYDNFPNWLKQYFRGNELITLVNVGGNNSKAENEPDNFVSTLEDYSNQMSEMLDLLKQKSSNVIFIGNTYIDETKTNPKHNPLTGGKSYMSNDRRVLFGDTAFEICRAKAIDFVDLEVGLEEWLERYLYVDGLHPNQAGHELIFEKVIKKLEEII